MNQHLAAIYVLKMKEILLTREPNHGKHSIGATTALVLEMELMAVIITMTIATSFLVSSAILCSVLVLCVVNIWLHHRP